MFKFVGEVVNIEVSGEGNNFCVVFVLKIFYCFVLGCVLCENRNVEGNFEIVLLFGDLVVLLYEYIFIFKF